MPKMANIYTITYHKQPAPGEPYKWSITEPIEISAMTQDVAERLGRRVLKLDDTWLVRECLNAGAWNKQ